jgi:hypothetical protein
MRILRHGLLCLLLLTPGGCGKGKDLPDLAPVTGTVTLDGQPLAEAEITFTPIGTTAGLGSEGRTAGDGKYQLKAVRRGAGAAAGQYKVVISKRVMPDGSVVRPSPDTPPIMSPGKELLSPQYSDPAQTTLTATVPAGGGTIDFPLKTSNR